MAKVKKKTGVTGERNRKAKGVRGKKDGASARGKRHGTAKAGRTRSGIRSATRKPGKTKEGKAVAHMEVKPLDPLRKCGPKTTVQFLYRVDEQVDGKSTPHLVFFDRHGWYCEHGRSCPAVGHARKFNGQIARVS